VRQLGPAAQCTPSKNKILWECECELQQQHGTVNWHGITWVLKQTKDHLLPNPAFPRRLSVLRKPPLNLLQSQLETDNLSTSQKCANYITECNQHLKASSTLHSLILVVSTVPCDPFFGHR
jgi:hypothetical protein